MQSNDPNALTVGVALLRLASYQNISVMCSYGKASILRHNRGSLMFKELAGVQAQACAQYLEFQFSDSATITVICETCEGIINDTHVAFPYSEENVLALCNLFQEGQVTGFALPNEATYVGSEDDDGYTESFVRLRAKLNDKGIEWAEGCTEDYNWYQQNTLMRVPKGYTKEQSLTFGELSKTILV